MLVGPEFYFIKITFYFSELLFPCLTLWRLVLPCLLCACFQVTIWIWILKGPQKLKGMWKL